MVILCLWHHLMLYMLIIICVDQQVMWWGTRPLYGDYKCTGLVGRLSGENVICYFEIILQCWKLSMFCWTNWTLHVLCCYHGDNAILEYPLCDNYCNDTSSKYWESMPENKSVNRIGYRKKHILATFFVYQYRIGTMTEKADTEIHACVYQMMFTNAQSCILYCLKGLLAIVIALLGL